MAWVEEDPSREVKQWGPTSRAVEAGKAEKDLEMPGAALMVRPGDEREVGV